MSIGTTLLAGITTTTTLLESVLSKRGTRIQKKIIAVNLMQRAINNTETYLVNSNRNYVPNVDLSQYWLDAFTAMIPVDKRLALRLRQKSKFWSNPQSWIREDGAMELVPDLQELNEKCEEILAKLNKR